MTPQRLTTVDDDRIRDLERHVLALSNLQIARDVTDPGLRRYLEMLPPQAAAELIDSVLRMRHALDRASTALESAGYTLEAYCALGEEERSSEAWQAVREAWEASGHGPRYLVRYTRGTRSGVNAYPTRRAAVEAAIEALEMCAAYPEAIELEDGTRVLNRAEILRMWEDRHDPG